MHAYTTLDLLGYFGSTDNYDMQYTEQLHIDYTKEAYCATNTCNELPQMMTWPERQEQIHQLTAYIGWQHRGSNNWSIPPPHPSLSRNCYIKLTRHPSIKLVPINDLQNKYGVEFFRAALARFVVLQRNPRTTHAHLEQDILDICMPSTNVSVYHRIQYQDDDRSDSGTVDTICIQPHRNDDKKGGIVEGRFDTALIHTREGGGIHGISIQTFVVFILLTCE